MLAFVGLEDLVPREHPLRTVKAVSDEALERLLLDESVDCGIVSVGR